MHMSSESIAIPQPAATVMLLRGDAAGMQVFMVVRHREADVHGGALVFPGGRVDAEDGALAADPDLYPPLVDADAAMAAARVAAIRETFEECGVLLARPRGSEAFVSGERLRSIEAQHRAALLRDAGRFGAMLAAEDLVLAPEAMVYFAHWISPERSPKRFDTRFFLAVAPPGQRTSHDGNETVDSLWLQPTAALEGADRGLYQIVFPTRMNLRKLATHTSPATALAAARASTVVTVMTRQERAGNGIRLLRIPLAAGYGGELFEALDSPAQPGRRPAPPGDAAHPDGSPDEGGTREL
jgi:8-oxo-dGTP pyrophosphatase MutT (NUDIX family)